MGGNLLVKNLQPFRNGPPRGIRTPDTQVRSLVLYPAELWADAFTSRSIYPNVKWVVSKERRL